LTLSDEGLSAPLNQKCSNVEADEQCHSSETSSMRRISEVLSAYSARCADCLRSRFVDCSVLNERLHTLRLQNCIQQKLAQHGHGSFNDLNRMLNKRRLQN
jgi:hypothetical protein